MLREVAGPSRLRDVALVVGAFASAGLLVLKLVSRASEKARHETVDAKRDKTLKDSFPASDPPASQYFDIPVNRQ
ncbi:MAG TPA: hypothetical protein VK629_02750 [Steroidobacteraceae bacterium]|nr:hypothetical protein [Steroidobacteraceae bacterium]